MLKINTKKVLTNFKGEELNDGQNPVQIGGVIANILAGQTSNPALAWVLGKKFACDDEVDLKAEEVSFVKKCMSENKQISSMILGQILEILE